MNIIKNITNSLIVVQWDAVDDFLPTTYTVTWTDVKLLGTAAVEEHTSYTITGLTLDTVYTITVTAANRCGSGPDFRASVSLSTDTTSTTSTISPTVTASTIPMTTTGNPNSISNPSTTTMTTNSITTTVNGNADVSTSRNSDTSTMTTTSSITIATNSTVSSTNTPTTDETSKLSTYIPIVNMIGASLSKTHTSEWYERCIHKNLLGNMDNSYEHHVFTKVYKFKNQIKN